MQPVLESNKGLIRGIGGKIKRISTYVISDLKENKVSYLLVMPYWTIFFVFTILPVIIAIALSFTYYNMLEPPQWEGLHNYLRLFLDDDVFLIAIKNTFVFALVTGPISFCLFNTGLDD